MKVLKFNENINVHIKVYYKRYSIYDDDIEFLLQDSEYLVNNCKIDNIIYYKYFDHIEPSHFTFKIYAFPINMEERVILDKMNFVFIRHDDENNKNTLINKHDLWTEVEFDKIETIINSMKFNI